MNKYELGIYKNNKDDYSECVKTYNDFNTYDEAVAKMQTLSIKSNEYFSVDELNEKGEIINSIVFSYEHEELNSIEFDKLYNKEA